MLILRSCYVLSWLLLHQLPRIIFVKFNLSSYFASPPFFSRPSRVHHNHNKLWKQGCYREITNRKPNGEELRTLQQYSSVFYKFASPMTYEDCSILQPIVANLWVPYRKTPSRRRSNKSNTRLQIHQKFSRCFVVMILSIKFLLNIMESLQKEVVGYMACGLEKTGEDILISTSHWFEQGINLILPAENK